MTNTDPYTDPYAGPYSLGLLGFYKWLTRLLWLACVAAVWLGLRHPPHHFTRSNVAVGLFYEYERSTAQGSLAQTLAKEAPSISQIATHLPERLLKLEGDSKKRLFIETVLPLIRIANYEVLISRTRLLDIEAKSSPSQEDKAFINALSKVYELKKPSLKELLKRVDVVPPSLALAQSIIESGWGSGRLAHEGNALFGERVFGSSHKGILPLEVAEDANFRLRKHNTLLDGVKSYVLNLNTLWVYEDFRSLRGLMRQREEPLDPFLLAGTLSFYSEEREDYVLKIQKIISDNNLTSFDLS